MSQIWQICLCCEEKKIADSVRLFSQLENLGKISASKSKANFSLKILTKAQLQNVDQTSATTAVHWSSPTIVQVRPSTRKNFTHQPDSHQSSLDNSHQWVSNRKWQGKTMFWLRSDKKMFVSNKFWLLNLGLINLNKFWQVEGAKLARFFRVKLFLANLSW